MGILKILYFLLFKEGHVNNIIKIVIAIVLLIIMSLLFFNGYQNRPFYIITGIICLLLFGAASEYFDRKSGIRYDDEKD